MGCNYRPQECPAGSIMNEGSGAGVQNDYSVLFNVQRTPLSDAFFSYANTRMIQYALRTVLKEKYGYNIGLQPWKPLRLAMMRYFNDIECDFCQEFNIEEGLDRVNAYTLRQLETRIIKNYRQQLGFLQWTDDVLRKIKLPRPLYDNIAWTRKGFDLSPYYNGCDRLYPRPKSSDTSNKS